MTMVATILRVDYNSLLLVLSHNRDHEVMVVTMTTTLHSFFNSYPKCLIFFIYLFFLYFYKIYIERELDMKMSEKGA